VEKPSPDREGFIVNLAGLKRVDFDSYLKAAEEAGLNVAEVSYSSVAWVRPEPIDVSQEKRCFIEIAPEGFELSVVDGSRLLYSRFSRFRPKVEEKCFYDEKAGDESPSFRIADQITEEFNRVPLVAGIEQMSDYLKRVFIAGGSVLRRPIGRRLAQKPFFTESVIRYMPEDSDAGFDYAAKVTGAMGLEREDERFNFMQDDIRPARREEAGRRMKLALYAALVLSFLWIVSGYGVAWKTVTDLEGRFNQLKSRAATLEAGDMLKEESRGYQESFNHFTSAHSLNINILDALTRALPRETYLTDMDMRPGEITIAGISSDASGLLKILEATPYFRSVRMTGAVKAEGGREKFRIGMEFE
ncbi:MAG: PilN domain-containing protein, partial [Nitrospinota bacterium]